MPRKNRAQGTVNKKTQAALTTGEMVLKRHSAKQAQTMEAHERKISSILNQKQGFWVSDFWAKVLGRIIEAVLYLRLLLII